jgi:hypothetical protein
MGHPSSVRKQEGQPWLENERCPWLGNKRNESRQPLTIAILRRRRSGEGIQCIAILIQVARGHQQLGYRDVAKTINLLSVRLALRRINLERVQICTATARKEMAVGMPLVLQVLRVVVVASHVKVHAILAK